MAGKTKAGFNEMFVCLACGRCFTDRSATKPMEVSAEEYLREVSIPHSKYPDDAELRKTVVMTMLPKTVENEGKTKSSPLEYGISESPVVIQEKEAISCCSNHTMLCDSRTVICKVFLNGEKHVVSAKHLETRDWVAGRHA